MTQKIVYLCRECKSEWVEDASKGQPSVCLFCESAKIYKSSHHQRYAKKSRSKVRWSYKV